MSRTCYAHRDITRGVCRGRDAASGFLDETRQYSQAHHLQSPVTGACGTVAALQLQPMSAFLGYTHQLLNTI